MSDQKGGYYVPEPSHWPIVGSIALFCMAFGAANWLNNGVVGPWSVGLGFLILCYMLYGWFSTVIAENQAGLTTSPQMERGFRIGMMWFIFTEVMLFATFFGVLLYTRYLAVPWLGGDGTGEMTHLLLWPNFSGAWPVLTGPNPSQFVAIKEGLHAWGTPALSTLVLLSSGVTITMAHWGLVRNNRAKLKTGLILTIILGSIFLVLQGIEYGNTIMHLNLKLSSGIYGSTFYMLTGLDGLHVLVGIIMLLTILGRAMKGHFTPKNHFAFDAITWYWHFVEFIWVMLFLFVYVL